MDLHENGITDYMFKGLVKRCHSYLLLLINGICKLDLKLDDINFGDTEESDSTTYKTINYDIKIESVNLKLDIEAQKKIVDKKVNEYGEYEYDINRAIYYLSLLHAKSYLYKEKGYQKKKSIVIFLYSYKTPGDSIVQKINLHNQTTNVEYDNIIYYSVSIAKIQNDDTMELHRALRMLLQYNIDSYKKDKSAVIREAALMLEEYDKSKEAMAIRTARLKAEYEEGIKLQAALDRGIEKGKAEGIVEGKAQGIIEGEAKATRSNIITMSKNGFDNETIARALSLDISYVNEVLNK